MPAHQKRAAHPSPPLETRRGRAQLYLHTGGGLSWWDTAGPAAVLLAGGATVTNAEGAPLRFRNANKHPHGLLCAAPGLAPLVLARLGLQ